MAFLMSAFFIVSACAGQKKRIRSSNIPEGELNGADALPQKPCKTNSSTEGLFLAAQGFQSIAGNDLTVIQDKKTKTLCDILLESKKKAGAFQFVGIKNEASKEEALSISSLIQDEGFDADFAHITIFTDTPSKLTSKKVTAFLEENAPGAIAARDNNEALWKEFTKDPNSPTYPTIVLMNLNTQGYVFNEPIQDTKRAVEIAEELLSQVVIDEIEDAPTPTPEGEDDQKVLFGWDGLSFKGNKVFDVVPVK